jgi:hypothetical protein
MPKQFTDLKQCFDFSRKGHNNYKFDKLLFLFILNENRLSPNIRFNFQSDPSKKALNNKPQRPQRPRLGPRWVWINSIECETAERNFSQSNMKFRTLAQSGEEAGNKELKREPTKSSNPNLISPIAVRRS